MIDHTQYSFGLLRDWMHFCAQVQDAAEVEFQDLPLDPDHVDEIQHAVRLLAAALDTHADGLSLVNLWLSQYRPWRLVVEPSVVSAPTEAGGLRRQRSGMIFIRRNRPVWRPCVPGI